MRVNATGIVDYGQVCAAMARRFCAAGGSLQLGTEVVGLAEDSAGVEVKMRSEGALTSVRGAFLISCSGLMADRTTRMLGLATDFQIVPFRGEYYQLAPQFSSLVNQLIYPIPDPALPFLGVHLTRMIDGSITVGPNAVLGWQREGYGRFNVSARDVGEMMSFPGFWPLLRGNLKTGAREFKNSLWKPGYLQQVRKYCPQLRLRDLRPYPAGIRAQAVLKDGSLVQDFLFTESPRSLHVCNAPSPAATSAIPIGAHICDKVLRQVPPQHQTFA